MVCGAKGGISGLVSAFTSLDDYIYLRLTQEPAQILTASASPSQPLLHEQIQVHMESEEERVPAATEEILVPLGVTIKVKRSRTIEHTVEIDWSVASEGRFDIGIKQMLSGSIRGEISRKQGRSSKESETMEYQIELSGDIRSQYRLVWTDIWRKGIVEFTHERTTHLAPFRFRERTELEVVPVTK